MVALGKRIVLLSILSFFAVPHRSNDGPIILAPLAGTTLQSLFDEPVYSQDPVPFPLDPPVFDDPISSDDPFGGSGGSYNCVLDGPTWLNRQPLVVGTPCYPSSCPKQKRCTEQAPNQTCKEGHWRNGSGVCDVCLCAQ